MFEVVEFADAAVDVKEFGGGVAFDDDGVGAFIEEFLQAGLAGDAGEEDDGDVWIFGIVADMVQEFLIGTIGGHGVEEDHAQQGIVAAVCIDADAAQKQLCLLGASAYIEIDLGLVSECVADLENKLQIVYYGQDVKVTLAFHNVPCTRKLVHGARGKYRMSF